MFRMVPAKWPNLTRGACSRLVNLLLFAALGLLLASCNLSAQYLFQAEQDVNPEAFEASLDSTAATYRIAPMDLLAVTVATNKGEALVDPNNEFQMGTGGGRMQGMGMGGGMGGNQNGQQGLFQQGFNQQMPILFNGMLPMSFLIDEEGDVMLPQVGKVKLGGLTLEQADSLLTKAYDEFYLGAFVKTQYLNKNITVITPVGNQNINLRNENVTLIEVIALLGGRSTGNINQFASLAAAPGSSDIQMMSKMDKIRWIRGNSMRLIDLTTPAGIAAAYTFVEPNDIIYLEPRRNTGFIEFTQSVGGVLSILTPIVGTVTSVLTLLILLERTEGG